MRHALELSILQETYTPWVPASDSLVRIKDDLIGGKMLILIEPCPSFRAQRQKRKPPVMLARHCAVRAIFSAPRSRLYPSSIIAHAGLRYQS